MFRLYTEKESYENICFWEEEKYPNWKKIISKNTDVCINISDDDLDIELENPESPIYLFLQSSASAKNPIALKSHFANLKEDISEILSEPRSVFILDIETEEAKKIQEEYGIAVFSKIDIDDHFLIGGFSKELIAGQIIEGGWKNLIDFDFPVSNALIISDNFLFKNEEAGKNLGLGNLPQLLDIFLPKKLTIDYHITIIIEDANKTKKWWERTVGNLKAEVIRLRDYPINFEIILTKTVHKRRIISNYLNGWTDKGFSIFKNSDINIVRGENDVNLNRIFNNIDDNGDTHYMKSENGINQLKKICDNVSEYIQNNGQSPNRMIFGDCNQDKTVKNRLFD